MDVFIAGEDTQAKARVSAFIESLGLRPMDAGRLTMARTLEHACMLWLGLMTHSVKHAKFATWCRSSRLDVLPSSLLRLRHVDRSATREQQPLHPPS